MALWYFHVVVVQKRAKNAQKSVMRVQSRCLLIKPIVVLMFFLPTLSLDLKASSVEKTTARKFRLTCVAQKRLRLHSLISRQSLRLLISKFEKLPTSNAIET